MLQEKSAGLDYSLGILVQTDRIDTVTANIGHRLLYLLMLLTVIFCLLFHAQLVHGLVDGQFL
jgi:hypothetical protein